MQSAILTRRTAHTALQDAFRRSGIPTDLIVLPMADDTRQLLVVQPTLVRWIWDIGQGGRRAEIEFSTPVTGYVTGGDIYDVLVNVRTFEAEMYGFTRGPDYRYSFELPFDITETLDTEAIHDLPFNPPKRPAPFRKPKCKGSLD